MRKASITKFFKTIKYFFLLLPFLRAFYMTGMLVLAPGISMAWYDGNCVTNDRMEYQSAALDRKRTDSIQATVKFYLFHAMPMQRCLERKHASRGSTGTVCRSGVRTVADGNRDRVAGAIALVIFLSA